jgi:uncharacterized protein DUF4145
MIVECHQCQAKVDGKVIAEHICRDEDDPASFSTFLLECPRCKTSLVGGNYDFEDQGELSRLWPLPEKYVPIEVPEDVKASLEEARVCFKSGAFNATTVMAGRALEAICKHFGAAERAGLGLGIRHLRDKGIIDARLGDWAAELQKARNLSAHASGERVSKQDAQDLLDFLNAISEYVFVLTGKFDEYMSRRKKSATASTAATGTSTPAADNQSHQA